MAKLPPAHGPFKPGNPAHTGYNKTIGSNWPYVEDPEVDMVKYHPNKTFQSGMSTTPIKAVWKDPTHATSPPIKTIHDNFRNASKEQMS